MSGEAVVSEGPQTSHDIVADVVNTAEASAEDTSAGEAPVEAAPVIEPPKSDPPKELSIEEQLLQEYGFKDLRRPDGREHYIARSKVLQMIGSGLKRGQSRWEGERVAIEAKAKELEAFRDQFAEAVRSDDTDAFITEVAKYNPRFARYIEKQAEATATAHAPVREPKPEPDIDLGNGRRTYSVEQNEKLVEWKARELLDAELKPFREREQATKAREQAEQARAAEEQWKESQRAETRSQIDEAQSWPMFGKIAGDGTYTDFQTAVLKRLQDDSAEAAAAGRRPRMTLKEAYLEERTAYLAADDNAKRQRWIEEANNAAKSTAVTRAGADTTRETPRSPKDIVRETVARLEAQSR